MLDLSSLNQFKKGNDKPTDLEFIYYLFWEKGTSLKEFNSLPLPYIFKILKVFSYIKTEEEKAYKKSKGKK